MKQLLRLVCFLFLLGYSLYATAQDTAAINANAPHLVFLNNDSVYDFGGVPQDLAVPYQFEIKNTGNSPLIITGMSCELSNVQCKWLPKAIKPGKRSVLTVTYTAKGDIGSFDADVYVNSNAWKDSLPLIHITGAIIPAESPYAPPAKPKNISVKVETTPSPLVTKPEN